MNEAIAAGILLISIIFIWRLVNNIQISINVTVKPTKVEMPGVTVKIEPAPIQFIEAPGQDPLYDKDGRPIGEKEKRTDPMSALNEIFHGITEVMNE